MNDVIVNKVAASGLISIDLEKYLPQQQIETFDLKEYLFMGLILKEKDFRESLKTIDWNRFSNKYVAITCSADAIIPVWAYMLVTSYVQPFASDIYLGNAREMLKHIFLKNISSIDFKEYSDQRVVVKGCGEVPVDNYAYAEITKHLLPYAKSIMYGEPCSTVPVFKKK
jgi:hypothetical protein